jgi:hypothetical protein
MNPGKVGPAQPAIASNSTSKEEHHGARKPNNASPRKMPNK